MDIESLRLKGDEVFGMQCCMCGSPELRLLGDLGKLRWFRCRDCGWDMCTHFEILAQPGEHPDDDHV